MSITGILGALLVSIFSSFYSAEKQASSIKPIEAQQCKAIVFDLGGVVVDTCKKKITWEIGPRILFDYWRNAKTTQELGKLRERFYSLMHATHPYTTSDATSDIKNEWRVKDGDGAEVPQLLAEWLRGMKPNQDIFDEVKQFAQKNPTWFTHASEKKALLKIARITLDPHLFIKTRKVFDESAELIRECKERGFKLYVLSNWDRESGKLLIEKYPNLFSLFDGIIFSGDVQKIKPEPEIFSYISDTIPAPECIFIDDQPENILQARELGFNTILVNHDSHRMGSKPNIQAIRDQLTYITPAVVTQGERYA